MAEAYYPKYYYDPRTQQYTLLNPVNPTPEESAGLAALREQASYGGGGSGTGASGPGSSGPGSGGVVGDVGLGLMGYSEATMGMAPGAAIAGMVGPAMADAAIAQNAAVDAALAEANAQANQATVSMGLTGPTVSTAVDISPVADPVADVQSIDAVSALAAENAAVAAEADADADAAAAAAAVGEAADAAGVGEGEGTGEGTGEGAGAAAGEGAGGAGEGGGGSGEGAGGAGEGASSGEGSGTGDGSGDGGSSGGGDGEKAGGVINLRKYQLGGSVMGMGDSAPQYAYGPLMMAKGGVAEAKQVQSQGRGQDTVLVHMTPKEVAGLQALAMSRGGSLTINPQTGLPEAGFLSSILPMAIGAAITATTGIPAWQAGLLVGGGTALATGSLGKGLMAGLGAFGGAGIGGALASAGSVAEAGSVANLADAAASAEAANAAALQSQQEVARNAVLESQLGGGNLDALAQVKPIAPPATVDLSTLTPEQQLAADNAYRQTYMNQVAQYQPPKSPFEQMGQGIKNIFSSGAEGEEARTRFMGTAADKKKGIEETGVGGLPGLVKYGGMAAAPVLAEIGKPKPLTLAGTGTPPQIRPYGLNVTNLSGTQAPLYTPTSTQEREMLQYAYSPMPMYRAAEGGEVPSEYDVDDEGIENGYEEGGMAKLAKMRKSLKGAPYYKFAQDRRDQSMEASIEQNFAAGGALPPRFLSGGGDGMSDSIKANIDGKQEARLADGEFVVPADVVSHLGNGSSKAGAKKLYAMMDRIRSARTGQKKQAPEVRAERYMPA